MLLNSIDTQLNKPRPATSNLYLITSLVTNKIYFYIRTLLIRAKYVIKNGKNTKIERDTSPTEGSIWVIDTNKKSSGSCLCRVRYLTFVYLASPISIVCVYTRVCIYITLKLHFLIPRCISHPQPYRGSNHSKMKTELDNAVHIFANVSVKLLTGINLSVKLTLINVKYIFINEVFEDNKVNI